MPRPAAAPAAAAGTRRTGRKNASYLKRPPGWGPQMVLRRLAGGERLLPWLTAIAAAHEITPGALQQEIHRWRKADPTFAEDYDALQGRKRLEVLPSEAWPEKWREIWTAAYVFCKGNVVRACALTHYDQSTIFKRLNPVHPEKDDELIDLRERAHQEIAGRAHEIFVDSMEQTYAEGNWRDAGWMAARLMESYNPAWARRTSLDVTHRQADRPEFQRLQEAQARLYELMGDRLQQAIDAGADQAAVPACLPALELEPAPAAPRRALKIVGAESA